MARVHSKNKEDRKPLECAICGKDFPRLSHLQRHQLIHIKEREWGCPFCERSFVQKPHLVRHIGRCHASEERTGLEERITANKWRADDIPVLLSASNTVAKPPSTPQLISDLIPSFLCIQCGAIFSTRTDLDRHSKNTHRPMKCNHCGEIFKGYAKLKSHEMQERDQAYACSCGASFARAAELRVHTDSCRKRGSFLCVECEEVFTQRVQLDRHWNRTHFVKSQCSDCGWTATTPLRLAEHALKEHTMKICGYCGAAQPSVDHVATEHWKRLNRSVALRKTDGKKMRTLTNKLTVDRNIASSCEEKEDVHSDEGSLLDVSKEDKDSPSNTKCSNSSVASTSGSDSDFESTHTRDEIQNTNHEENHLVLPESSNSAEIVAPQIREKCYLNVVVSVPDDVVDEFHFGNRLPPEILRLFPEFASARLCLVEPFVGESRFLSLHIPVMRPPESNTEAARLLSVPIYV
ncbi:zinc finger, C2H2 type [Necator americanus]|uniref:Zinc finger, C2H2 type n=1 Tax=Necator americanus TaxID=51031 RepID=W2T8B0_NECAM|nr:zinc finger, C2H2 type [Necator americanus]ETN78118.1 zinc finger, C2H2 type [Necator americanus]